MPTSLVVILYELYNNCLRWHSSGWKKLQNLTEVASFQPQLCVLNNLSMVLELLVKVRPYRDPKEVKTMDIFCFKNLIWKLQRQKLTGYYHVCLESCLMLDLWKKTDGYVWPLYTRYWSMRTPLILWVCLFTDDQNYVTSDTVTKDLCLSHDIDHAIHGHAGLG